MEREPNEYDLALRARDGDRDALTELVERTRVRLFALAYAELRHYEDAQDAVAASLLQICLHVGELRQPESIRAWMQSIVRNEVRRLRRGLTASVTSLEEVEHHAGDANPSLLRMDIERALQQLPTHQAQAIRLFYLDDLSTREIAERMGRTKGTITGWLHRGRRHLAAQMEEHTPMTSAPTLSAAIIHTDLEPALLRKVRTALRTAGYSTKVIKPGDPARVLETLKGYQAIILDERIGSHSAFEFLMHTRASPETRQIPVCLLCSAPSVFTVSAYFAAGATRLVNKQDPEDMARLAIPFEKPPAEGRWSGFTVRARRLVFFAQEEAARLGENHVGSEHLLLGLLQVPDSAGARILVERLGISLESTRAEIEPRLTRGEGNRGQDMQLTPRVGQIIDFSWEEAQLLGHDYISTEHLLLGLIREKEGLGGQVLRSLGADLERTRREVKGSQSAPPGT
jgi:RNA polymerase sigma factor (sigma-70 family)